MIYIQANDSDISNTWKEEARKLTESLARIVDDPVSNADGTPNQGAKTAHQKRQEFINDNSDVWGKLKATLLKWSHGKCWYSEVKELGSDYHVDHFRPKGRVRHPEKEGEREGYWWLAFDWTNYRIASSWCNTGHGRGAAKKGKEDYFPLQDNSFIADAPNKPTSKELPLLLDPTDPEDPGWLSFDETGMPVPSHSGALVKERVRLTVKILHLDSEQLKEARSELWRKCLDLIKETEALLEAEITAQDALRRQEIKNKQHQLRELVRRKAPLSATARACLRKSGREWVLALLNAT